VPDGILTNSSLAYVRTQLEVWFRIVAVISLPQTTFTHTGAGVKSSVLFLKKWDKDKKNAIKDKKDQLADQIWEKYAVKETLDELETDKIKAINNLVGFDNPKKLSLKDLKKDEGYKQWKIDTQNLHNEKINDFYDSIDEIYQTELSKIQDYPIFMAIADNIGFDATGKSTDKTIATQEWVENGETWLKETKENDFFQFETIRKKDSKTTKKTQVLQNTGIAGELSKFIEAIENGQDHFFA
jgi:type I restriction enzyme M protein